MTNIIKILKNATFVSVMDGMEGHYGYKRIVRELWPMVLMLIVTSVYSIVDGWFISN